MLDSIISELESRFSEDNRAHYELCSLMPDIMLKTDDLETLLKNIILKTRSNLLPSSDDTWNFDFGNNTVLAFHMISTTKWLSQDADSVFPNIKELFCILAVLP